MVVETDVLLSPIGEVEVIQGKLAPRLGSLKGKVGAFLDNHKINSDVYLARVEEVLTRKYGLARAIHYQKPDTSRPTPPEVLDDLARKAAFVVHAHGD
ncbi:MAG: hypothetical protein HYX92_14240 [Chloroflexi bacterium]|nr:hypothetical protein [Chloroflexota bacterium]